VDYLRVTMKTIALTPEQYEKVRQKKLALQSKLKRELSYGELIIYCIEFETNPSIDRIYDQ
tara:strand:+ start:304 stop:486 length:183 start_codon:yes stop_codon:yes gene_type:complete